MSKFQNIESKVGKTLREHDLEPKKQDDMSDAKDIVPNESLKENTNDNTAQKPQTEMKNTGGLKKTRSSETKEAKDKRPSVPRAKEQLQLVLEE